MEFFTDTHFIWLREFSQADFLADDHFTDFFYSWVGYRLKSRQWEKQRNTGKPENLIIRLLAKWDEKLFGPNKLSAKWTVGQILHQSIAHGKTPWAKWTSSKKIKKKKNVEKIFICLRCFQQTKCVQKRIRRKFVLWIISLIMLLIQLSKNIVEV